MVLSERDSEPEAGGSASRRVGMPAVPGQDVTWGGSAKALAYDDLREWIAALEKAGELKRVTAEVSPELEMTEIADRMSKTGNREQPPQRLGPVAADPGQGIANRKTRADGKYAPGGPALLFENVKGHPGHKVLMNQFGSQRRMAMALGVERLDEIAERISGLMNVKAPEGFLDKLKMLPQLGALASAFPKTVSAKDAPCKEVSAARGVRPRSFSDSEVLAAGWGAIHHAAVRLHAEPGDGQAECGDVPDAGVRRADHGDALAAAEGGGGALPRSSCGGQPWRARAAR